MKGTQSVTRCCKFYDFILSCCARQSCAQFLESRHGSHEPVRSEVSQSALVFSRLWFYIKRRMCPTVMNEGRASTLGNVLLLASKENNEIYLLYDLDLNNFCYKI